MNKNISAWDALDLEKDNPDQQIQAQLRLDLKRKFQACFGTPAGQFVLEYLNGKYFNSPVVDEHAVNVLAKAGIREGELRTMRFIHLMLQPEK